jgi:acetamidase/formamidase
MTDHALTASPKTSHWGYFDASEPPALKIKSGDRVKIDTVTGNKEHLPTDPKFHVPPAVREIHEALKAGPGPHILTGPVYVEGAKPGSVLEVRIIDIGFFQDWGFQVIIPLLGTLPLDFGKSSYSLIPIDIEAKLATLSWGLKLPVKPFFGVMGVAPPPGWGKVSTTAPQAFGGNLDNK